MKKVSVIIPVKNGEATLQSCLQSLFEQTIASQLEIIILDSSSTDRSLEIAKRFGAKIFSVKLGTFNHGLTRNEGVNHASGDILFFTVQDATLAAPDMLEKMISHFQDLDVQAVCGHQAIPEDKEKNPALWFKRTSTPVPVDKKAALPSNFQGMSAKKQWQYCAWDNVIAMYRKSALEQIPFQNTMHTEDWIWARQALMKDFKLIYDSSIVAYHYHHKYFRFTFSNEFIVASSFYYFFDKKLPACNTSIKRVATFSYRIWRNKSLKVRDRLYWTFHNLSSEIAVASAFIAFRFFALFGHRGINAGWSMFCKTVPIGKSRSQL